MDERLLNASINDLAAFLRGRFQMKGPWAADTDAREPELPYGLPLAVWEEADELMRRNLTRAAETLIGEVSYPEAGWSAEAVEWLVSFIDLADIQRLRSALGDAAESGRWLRCPDDPARCHMVLLRTLLDMGWATGAEFWLHLPEDVQRRYPALAFRGLLADGATNEAFAYLRQVACDPPAVRQILDVLADVMEDAKTREEVRQQLECSLAELPREAADEFREGFRFHGWGMLDRSSKRERKPVRITRQHLRAVRRREAAVPEPRWAESRINGSNLLFARLLT